MAIFLFGVFQHSHINPHFTRTEYVNALKNEVLPSTPKTAPAAFGDLEETKRRLFTYTNVSAKPKAHQNTESLFDTPTHSKFGNNLLKMKTQFSLQKDRSKPRLISACPWKVLDAPELQVCQMCLFHTFQSELGFNLKISNALG